VHDGRLRVGSLRRLRARLPAAVPVLLPWGPAAGVRWRGLHFCRNCTDCQQQHREGSPTPGAGDPALRRGHDRDRSARAARSAIARVPAKRAMTPPSEVAKTKLIVLSWFATTSATFQVWLPRRSSIACVIVCTSAVESCLSGTQANKPKSRPAMAWRREAPYPTLHRPTAMTVAARPVWARRRV